MGNVKINFLKKSPSEWFDYAERRTVKGDIHAYEIIHDLSGKWIINVKVTDEKVIIEAVTSEKTEFLHQQIKNKTVVFNKCGSGYYHPIGIAYMEGDRFKYSRAINELEKIPEDIKDKFELKRFKEIASPKKFHERYVAVIGKEEINDMVFLFFLERIRPVFEDSE